jgi:hypothetical protein
MWQIAVPTYRRSTLLNQRTLRCLLDGGVPPERITIFAGDRDDYPLPAGVQLRRVPAGRWRASNAITDHYPEDQELVCVDDDVKVINRLTADRKRLEPVTDLPALFDAAFAAANREQVTLWGVSPVSNPFFMRPAWECGLWFCIGTLFGVRNRRQTRAALLAKDDYERTLQHYQLSGAVLRLRDVTFKAEPMRVAAGGMQADLSDRRAAEEADVAELERRWPGLVHRKASRNGYPEIALRVSSALHARK